MQSPSDIQLLSQSAHQMALANDLTPLTKHMQTDRHRAVSLACHFGAHNNNVHLTNYGFLSACKPSQACSRRFSRPSPLCTTQRHEQSRSTAVSRAEILRVCGFDPIRISFSRGELPLKYRQLHRKFDPKDLSLREVSQMAAPATRGRRERVLLVLDSSAPHSNTTPARALSSSRGDREWGTRLRCN